MVIVLFYPRGYKFDRSRPHINSIACVMPPIGLASIAAVLRKAGHDVTVFDGALQPSISNQEWAKKICAIKPDLVGFSATTSAFQDAYDVCARVKHIIPQCKAAFGGVHVSWGKGELLKQFKNIDYIIAGEGEIAFRSIADGEPPSTYDRVYYRNGKDVCHGKNETPVCQLDELPFPAYDLLKGFPNKYLMPLFSYPRHPGANIISSRGCVYQCSYCDRSVFGKSFRWNSPEYTFQQMLWLKRDFGVRHVNFYDDLFTLNRARVAELCERLATSKLKMSFNCIVRIGHIDKELIKLLKKGGCWMVSVGIESGDQALLDTHKDGLSLDAIRRDIKLLHDSGLWVKGLFMMGFPGETESGIIKTREFALSLPLKDANVTAFTPFPGAPISQEIERLGAFNNNWSKLDCVNFVFVSKEIKDISILKKHYALFYEKFYSRPYMRKEVYPKMLFQSTHSLYRLVKNSARFLDFTRSLKV
jgi:anaerobic magnesium-protoporphyrin IX monomethyl ester cyclase